MRASHFASRRFGFLTCLGALSISWVAWGQAEPPVPPPLSDAPEAPASDSAPTGSAPTDGASTPVDPYAGDAAVDPYAGSVEPTVVEPPGEPLPGSDAAPDDEDYKAWRRRTGMHEQNSLGGSTGLMRVHQAGSGPVGSFRFDVKGSYFAQSGFLCAPAAPCTDRLTGFALGNDDAQRAEALATLSVTPFSFLEIYGTIRNSVTSNTNNRPQVLQVVGDSSLGVKAFSPDEADQIFSYGGEAELGLLTGTGGVGLDAGATSFALRALATADLSNRSHAADRLPLRFHANLGYFFDNSGAVVSSAENTPFPGGRGGPVERTERYGLNASRVDAFQIGLGAEFLHDYARPFLEWTLDVPVNRQGYVCNLQGAASRGDLCLGAAAGLPSSPSRLTLGTRVFPWQASGLAITGALDIGTGGTTVFLEETRPETPYMLWLGIGYAVDTVPVEPKMVEVAVATPTETALLRFIVGRVVDQAGRAAIPDAILRFEGGAYTGMVADSEGRFRTGDLRPGTYRFKVYADQFREGTCEGVVPEAAVPAPGSGAASAEATLTPEGTMEVPVTCQLKELPRVADVIGLVIDAVSGSAVPDATITITDKLNRSLTLAADAQGSLQFKNVPFGISRLTASAPGYMTTVMPINLDSRKQLEVHVVLNKRPKNFSVEVGARELKLTKPIQFVSESADVAADSMVVIEELAAVLGENAKIQQVEVQVHADDAGAPSYSRTLTQERADTIRQLLVQMGVDEGRVVAKGYGPDQPLAPNVSDANREKNRRVQVLVLKR